MCDRDAQAFASRAKVQQTLGNLEEAVADFQQAAALWLNQGEWERGRRLSMPNYLILFTYPHKL